MRSLLARFRAWLAARLDLFGPDWLALGLVAPVDGVTPAATAPWFPASPAGLWAEAAGGGVTLYARDARGLLVFQERLEPVEARALAARIEEAGLAAYAQRFAARAPSAN